MSNLITQFMSPEVIPQLVVQSVSQVKLPAGGSMLCGGRGVILDTDLLSTLDTGALAASTLYYVYVVILNNAIGLVLSLSASSPSGYTIYRKIGRAFTNGNSQIIYADYESKVYAEYNTTSGQSIPNNTDTIINFDTPVIDTHGAMVIGASCRFVAPKPLLYCVSAKILANQIAWTLGNMMALDIYKNGSLYATGDRVVTSGLTAYYSRATSRDIFLQKDEYISMKVYHSCSSGTIALFTGATQSWITISSK